MCRPAHAEPRFRHRASAVPAAIILVIGVPALFCAGRYGEQVMIVNAGWFVVNMVATIVFPPALCRWLLRPRARPPAPASVDRAICLTDCLRLRLGG